MLFFSDKECMEMDIFWAFGVYLMLGGGRNSVNDNWILPHLANLSQPAAKLSGYLKHCIEKGYIPEDDYTSTSLRIGSVNFIVNHPQCDLWHGIVRGGWDFSGIVTIFEYLLKVNRALAIGGRCLSGWNQVRVGC